MLPKTMIFYMYYRIQWNSLRSSIHTLRCFCHKSCLTTRNDGCASYARLHARNHRFIASNFGLLIWLFLHNKTICFPSRDISKQIMTRTAIVIWINSSHVASHHWTERIYIYIYSRRKHYRFYTIEWMNELSLWLVIFTFCRQKSFLCR